MFIHCVGYTGQFGQSDPWSVQQDILPRSCALHAQLRVAVCGAIWDGNTSYGFSEHSLYRLQERLDSAWDSCLDCFDGDFSFCYLTPDRSEIRLYQSITSTRCLYYHVANNGIIWATNPASCFPGNSPTIDAIDVTMVTILAATGMTTEERTCYRDLCCIPAGIEFHYRLDGRQSRIRHDYALREDNSHLAYDQAAKRLRELIEVATSRSFYGFDSVNVFLSGGLDTAIVAYEATKLGKEIHGYHWSWKLPLFQDELSRAQKLADHLNISFHPLDFTESLAGGSSYLSCMRNLVVPYNHAFYQCYQDTIQTISTQQVPGQSVQVLGGGHLGDTLFQGDWLDMFAMTGHSLPDRWKTFCGLLAWYKRKDAFAIFRHLLQGKQRLDDENPNVYRVSAYQRFFTPQAFHRVLQDGNLDYRMIQSPYWQKQQVGAREIEAALRSSFTFTSHLETAIIHHDALPQNIVMRHPLSDRGLHEFCMSLGPQHRSRWFAGTVMSKFLMRLAYTGDLPAEIINREIRSPYAAISQQFCLQNKDQLSSLFDSEASQLVRLGIIDHTAMQEVLATTDNRLTYGQAIVRMAGVEIWLRDLLQHPFLPEMPTKDQRPYILTSLPHESALIQIAPKVTIKVINQACILFHRDTLEVSRLDEIGIIFLQAALFSVSWADATDRIIQDLGQDTTITQEQVMTFFRHLADAAWIVFKQ